MEIIRESFSWRENLISASAPYNLYGKKEGFLIAPIQICIHNQRDFINFRNKKVFQDGNELGTIFRGSWPPNSSNGLSNIDPVVLIRPDNLNILDNEDILNVDINKSPEPRSEFPTLEGEIVQIKGTNINGKLLASTQGDEDFIDRSQVFPGTLSNIPVYLVDFFPRSPGNSLIGSPIILPENRNQVLGMLINVSNERKCFIYPAHFVRL